MALTDTIALPAALQLLGCFRTQLAKLAKPPANVGLRIGNQTGPMVGPNVDECCEGLAWVRVAGNVPSWEDFAAPTTTFEPCGVKAYAVALELGVARCMPWGQGPDNLDPPSQEQWDDAAIDILNDDAAMRAAIRCCFPPAPTPVPGGPIIPIRAWIMGGWEPLPIEGGCTGGTRTVQVQVIPACEDC